jgi:hypothetical protein
VRRTILAIAAVLAASAANAQSTIYPHKLMDSKVGAQQIQDAATRQYLISRGGILLPTDNSLLALATLVPVPLVVINGGKGGSIPEHISRFGTLGRSGAPVEMHGGCYSACTLILAYVAKEKLCFAPGAFLTFHAATWTPKPPYQIAPAATRDMYLSYPVEVRQWIDARGGYDKLTVESYWTMYDHDLWAIGYAKCR